MYSTSSRLLWLPPRMPNRNMIFWCCGHISESSFLSVRSPSLEKLHFFWSQTRQSFIAKWTRNTAKPDFRSAVSKPNIF